MRKLVLAAVLLFGAQQASAAVVDSIGLGFSPLTLYTRSSLRDTGFPTTIYMLGATNRYRVEYTEYSNDLPSDVRTRQYNNSALLGYYNMEFLLRARRGSILGRTRLYLGAGGGLFRSRLNEVSNVNENNVGWGILSGFRYFANKNFYVGAEAKYLSATITYEQTSANTYEDANIGGLFLTLQIGFRFSE